MANFIEVGHSKNVANFEDLISFCIAYGSVYNPANSNITIAGLQAKHTAAIADLQALKVAKTALDNSTNSREILFKDFKKLATRVLNALSAVSPAKQTIADAKTINNKIQGKRAATKKKPLPTDPPLPEDNSISVSQLSYDSLMDHFAKLIETVSQEPLYTPNEPDLSVAGLSSLLTQMQTVNTGVISSTTAYSNAKIQRDKTLYDKSTGLAFCAEEVKMYVKSLFGASSPQYKQVVKLKFKKQIS